MYDDIVVPTDGSDYADSAAETAFDLADHHDATVHVVCAVDPGPLGKLRLPGDAASAEAAIEAKANQSVDRLEDRATERGLAVETATPSGPPGETILEYAEEAEADLVVMGTRGQGGVHRMAVGSVADYVIRFGDVQVLIAETDDG